MTFDFAALKAQARASLHETMAVPALYSVPGMPGSTELRVRWHNKIVINGDLVEAGYAEQIEGLNRVIFQRAELDAKGIALARGHQIQVWDAELAEYSEVLLLDSLEPKNGPGQVIWRAVQK